MSDRNRQQPVVVAGLTLNGSTVTRSLSRQGFDVVTLSYSRSEQGWSSRFGRKFECPNPDEDYDAWHSFMLQLSEQFDEPPGVLPMSDAFVVALDRAAADPSFPYKCHGMGKGLRTALTRKSDSFELAERFDFPRPKSAAIRSREDLIRFWDLAGPKILIKPDLSLSWRRGKGAELAGEAKVLIGDRLDLILEHYDRMAPHTPGILAQEVIPGSDDHLIYWCGFLGPDGKVGGSLVGRKLRVIPIHFGSASFVELVDMPEVDEVCIDFLTRLEYHGICGIELKKDPRDGVAKLIEVNPRYGLWDDIGATLGVDLAREATDAFYGKPTVRARPRKYGRRWVSVGRDLSALWHYRRAGDLTIPAWLRSLRPPLYINDFPIFSDPGFALATLRSRLTKLHRHVRSAGPNSQ